jgi:predicted ATPase/DNA-binding winged helix-turn-helix (wHTH) protein
MSTVTSRTLQFRSASDLVQADGIDLRQDFDTEPAGTARPRDVIAMSDADAEAILFGPFRLLPAQRLLLEGNTPVKLGSRALELLIALVEQPGELVSKNALMARVWPDTTVVEANLSVHIAALRHALRDGQGANRYLVNMPGRGYRFVAPITFEAAKPSAPIAAAARGLHNLPKLLTAVIGREANLEDLTGQLLQRRLITVTGPGGIGKSAIALAFAERQIDSCEDGVWLVDLAPLADARDVPGAVTAALGLPSRTDQPLPGLLAHLRQKRLLLVLDNCTRLVAAVAALTTDVLRSAPGVQILATSREPLRVPSEYVHRVLPLPSPSPSPRLRATEALAFSAVQLFVERLTAVLGEFALKDADAPIVADICRKLDGIPLAIEFAAARAAILGLRGVAGRVDYPLAILVGGHRTAPPRQQTMQAALEWSYTLLSALERSVLQRLSLFDDPFTFQAAAAVAADGGCQESEIINILLELVAKSLVMADIQGSEPRLWLLGTTRAFARTMLSESDACETFQHRHPKNGSRPSLVANLAVA